MDACLTYLTFIEDDARVHLPYVSSIDETVSFNGSLSSNYPSYLTESYEATEEYSGIDLLGSHSNIVLGHIGFPSSVHFDLVQGTAKAYKSTTVKELSPRADNIVHPLLLSTQSISDFGTQTNTTNTSSSGTGTTAKLPETLHSSTPSLSSSHQQLSGAQPPRPKDRPVRCQLCPRSFTRRSDLERHNRSRHEQADVVFCSVKACKRSQKGFKRKDHMESHYRRMHIFDATRDTSR